RSSIDGRVSSNSYVEAAIGATDWYVVYAPMTRCAAPNIVGTIPANTNRPANVKPKLAWYPMPTSNTTTVLSATKTWDPFAVACIHTTEAASLFAASSDTSRNRLLRIGCALNI